MLNNYLFKFFYLIILFLLFSCSFDYKEAMVEEEISGKTPNAVIINLDETVIKKGVLSYSLKAGRAEAYDKKNLTVFTDVQFTEYDKKGWIATEGEVGHTSFYSDTENIEFEKSFRIESLQQGYYIEGESIFWDGKEKILTSDFDKETTIGKKDGSRITGRKFTSKASNNSFTFESIEGTYVADDKEKKEKKEKKD